MSKKKLTLDETLEAVHDMADFDEQMEAVLAQSDDAIEQELKKDGLDVAALSAKLAAKRKPRARQVVAKTQPEAPSNVVAIRPERRALWIGAGLVAAAIPLVLLSSIGAITIAIGRPVAPTPPSTGTSAVPPGKGPAKLREEAFAACADEHWQLCIDELDDAAAVDPKSEQMPEVRLARKAAVLGLRDAKDGG